MKRWLKIALLPFYYLYYFLHPLNILNLIRQSYFYTFIQASRISGLRSPGIYIAILHLIIVGILFAVGLHLLMPLFGYHFYLGTAVRVFFGFLGGFILYSFIGSLYTAFRATRPGSSAADGFKATPVVFALGTPAAVAGALCAGITGNLFWGVLVAGCELALVPSGLAPLSVEMRAIFACLFGGMLTVIGLGASRLDLPIAEWLRQLGTALLVALGLLFVLLLFFVGLRRLRPMRHLPMEFVALLLWIALMAMLSSYPLAWVAESTRAGSLPQWCIALTCGFVVSRFPLWPLEALWGRLTFESFLASAVKKANALPHYYRHPTDTKNITEPYRLALHAAYFDRRTLLPLPGESDALFALSQVSTQLACEEALELLTSSPRTTTAQDVLLRLAQKDPLGAFSPIADLGRSPRDTKLAAGELDQRLTGAPALVFQALTLIHKYSLQVPGLFEKTGVPEQTPEQRLDGIYQAMSQLGEQAREMLQTAAVLVERAMEEPAVPRGTQLLRTLLRQALRELVNLDTYRIQPVEVRRELLTELEDKLYTKNNYDIIFSRFESYNSIAYSINNIPRDASISIQKTKLLEVMSNLHLFVTFLPLRTNQLMRDKLPGAWLLDELLLPVEVHWRLLIAKAAKQLAQGEPTGPIENPFIVGQPVRGSQFFGRQQLMSRLTALWGKQPQWPSVLLHGHRRMGKSSILHNLAQFLDDKQVALAILSMQELGEVAGAKEFLRPLARKIQRAIQTTATDEELALFDKLGPYEAFEEFLHKMKEKKAERRLMIAIDEYEKLDELMNENIIESRLLEFIRALIDENPWLCFVFAGNHTHNELDQEHWQRLFRTVLSFRVSFLSEVDARLLLTAPTPDFPMSYEPAVLEHAVQLTAGQPFLLQLLGYSLLERLNDRRLRDPQATLSVTDDDLSAILEDAEFYQRGAGYFEGVRLQVAEDAPEAAALLQAMAASPPGVDAKSLAQVTKLEPARFREGLDLLVRHEVLKRTSDGGIYFTVELMRRFMTRGAVQGSAGAVAP